VHKLSLSQTAPVPRLAPTRPPCPDQGSHAEELPPSPRSTRRVGMLQPSAASLPPPKNPSVFLALTFRVLPFTKQPCPLLLVTGHHDPSTRLQSDLLLLDLYSSIKRAISAFLASTDSYRQLTIFLMSDSLRLFRPRAAPAVDKMQGGFQVWRASSFSSPVRPQPWSSGGVWGKPHQLPAPFLAVGLHLFLSTVLSSLCSAHSFTVKGFGCCTGKLVFPSLEQEADWQLQVWLIVTVTQFVGRRFLNSKGQIAL